MGHGGNQMQPPPTTSRSKNDEPNNDEPNSDETGSEGDRDTSGHNQATIHRIIEPRDYSPLFSARGSSKMTHTTKSKDNLRVYGTLRPKAPFDVFVKCVISAWALAPKSTDKPVEIRAYARPNWKQLGRHSERRAEWQKLYEARHEPEFDVAALGHQLLLSQDILQHLVPDERLQRVKTQIQASRVRTRHRKAPGPSSRMAIQQLPDLRSENRDDHTIHLQGGLGHQAVARQAIVDFRQSHLQMPITFACSEAARCFPRLVQATPTLSLTQACFVPTSTREYDSNGCFFVLNTPDAVAGRVITAPDVRLACQQASFEGFKDVIRRNHNLFVAYFGTRAKAKRAGHVWKLNFPVVATACASTNPSTLIVRPSWYLPGAHNLFCCSIPEASTNTHVTIIERIFEALDGPMVASFQLLKQKTTNDRVRYMLRRPASAPPIYVERFYIPLMHLSHVSTTWDTFPGTELIYCVMQVSRRCDAGGSDCASADS